MSKKTKIKRAAPMMSDKQKAIDEAWSLLNRAMDACEELNTYLDELSDEYEDLDFSTAIDAGYEAHSAMENPYSNGGIMPKHSSDGGKA